MKKLVFTLIVSFLLAGCADKDAYSKFELLKDQEVAFDNVTLAKITKADEVSGVLSALYLNAVYPKRYEKETFYVIVYSKDKRLLENLEFSLNGVKPLSLTVLPPQNEFSHLLDIKNDWSHYYLVEFKPSNATKLKLSLKLLNKAQASVTFEKTQR